MKLLKIIRNSTFLLGLAPVPFLLACKSEGISPDQKEVNEFAKNFDTKNPYKTIKKIYPTWLKHTPISYEDIGISDENLGKLIKEKDKIIQFTYEVIAVNQLGGEVYIDVILQKNKAIKRQPIKIKDFLKWEDISEEREVLLKEILTNKNLETSKKDILPGNIGSVGREIDVSGLGIKEFFNPQEMKEYDILSDFKTFFKSYNNKNGTVTVDIQLKTAVRWERRGSENNLKYPIINIENIVISGYQKT